MLTNVNNFNQLSLGLVLNYRYFIKKIIKTGLFFQVYLVEDLSYHQDCLMTVFIWSEVINKDIVSQEIKEMFNPLDKEQLQQIKYSKEFWCDQEKIFIIQKTSEENLPENLYSILLPLNEYEVIQLLNQVLVTLRNKQDNDLLDNFHKLALTALILLNGQYLYEPESKTWNWKNAKKISDQRKIVIQRMLGEDNPFSSIDEILQALNTIFLESSAQTSSPIPLSWYIAGGIGSLLILTGLVGIFGTQSPTSKSPLSNASSLIKCPKSPNQVAIACDLEVSDIDSIDFDTGKLTVKFQGKVTEKDRLIIFQTKGTNNNEIRIGDKLIGTFAGGIGKKPLEITFNSEANREILKSLISNIVYENVGKNQKKGERKIDLQLTDGDGGKSNILTRVISINPMNQAPQLKVPSSLSMKEDQRLTIKGISLEDKDAGNNIMTIELQVSNGIIQVRDDISNGINWNEIYEKEPGIIQLVGTLKQINNTLKADQSIIYQSHPDFEGTDTLTITVTDGGHPAKENIGIIYPSGALEAQTNSQAINIGIVPINDPPQLAQSRQNEKTDNNPPLSTQDRPDTQSLTKRTAVNLVESWLNAKANAYGSNYDSQMLEQYTTGEYRRKSEGTRDWLIGNNAYYTYGGLTVEPAGELTVNGTQATIDIKVTENPTLYMNGQVDRRWSQPSTGVYRWTLQFEGGTWKISNNLSL